ncbi:MAG: tRNA-queuosine alpha-mannosyltransferase domain-containing protein [Tepidisphaeraceae bacterium]
MSSQLDILALEPFFGGNRRVMLESLIRCSRHRWLLLKLPPRRIERRLTAAAHWFAEQLSRHWIGRIDVLFTSEAMNLSDLLRMTPELAKKPSVVYFHSNQLPLPGEDAKSALDLVNLGTANAASEIWFNSLFHLRSFLARATALVDRHPELSSRNPLPDIAGKAHVMPPPVDLASIHALTESGERPPRDKRTIFVETRDADVKLLNAALSVLTRRGERFQIVTIGPVEELAPDLPRTTLSEKDDTGQARALLGAGVFLSTKTGATHDHHCMRALAAGCWPVLPDGCVYADIIPESVRSSTCYDPTPQTLASRIQDAWHLARPDGWESELQQAVKTFDPIAACKAMDQRLEELAIIHTVNGHRS